MTTRFVTRHSGAADWLRRQGISAEVFGHLEMTSVQPGDVVIGNLPAHLAAEIAVKGGRYIHLAMTVPEHLRGQNLNADQMDQCGARLVPLQIAFDMRPAEVATPRPSKPTGTTLVTLLGTPKTGDYEKFVYHFGPRHAESRWMPEALIRMCADTDNAIRRLIIVGTRGSGWDLLARIAKLDGSLLEYDLFSEVESQTASVANVHKLQSHLAKHLGIEDVVLLIAPYADDPQASAVLAGQIASVLRKGEQVVFDMTFGLRDVMLTTFACALALEHLNDIRLRDVIYASIKAQSGGQADVLSIGAVREIIAWVRALSVLDATGDMRPLSKLLKDNTEIADLISRQYVDEKMLRPRRAAQRAHQLLAVAQQSQSPRTMLFLSALKERLDWAMKGEKISWIQAALARRSLADGDLMRATALAFEACISAHMEQEIGDAAQAVEDPGQRSYCQAELNASIRSLRRSERREEDADYLVLKGLRNALLHASRATRSDIVSLLNNPDQLAGLIDKCLKARVERD
ncbi:CRISPR-associated protein Csx16 [Oryzibacter oryziterrae]|uniref:CRISPR-associated protein Csx16 n=1 Tax=Oryzibacter oryziterrae TaxID=2766474 RepID=UPI001EFF80A4|nr:CRISPR-associated protein Csx16 [Oryzibacter oryziterrae]